MKQLFATACLALLLSACGNSFDIRKVQVGMTRDEVVRACGNPHAVEPLMTSEVYIYDTTGVVFEGDIVVSVHPHMLVTLLRMENETWQWANQ